MKYELIQVDTLIGPTQVESAVCILDIGSDKLQVMHLENLSRLLRGWILRVESLLENI